MQHLHNCTKLDTVEASG